MEVILREDIEKLGGRGEVVKVAPGYARNFLLPRRMAVLATDANRKIVEQERQAHLRREAKLEGEAQDLGKLLSGVNITIARKAGENLFEEFSADMFDHDVHAASIGDLANFAGPAVGR